MITETPLLDNLSLEVAVPGVYGEGFYGEFGFGYVWREVIPEATGVTIRRGGVRDGLGIRQDVGLLTFALHNAQDPLAGGEIRPGQAVRVLSEGEPVFTGRVAHLGSQYVMDKSNGKTRTVTTVTVADAVKIHAATMRYGVQIAEGFETFESRINRLAASAQAPIDAPTPGATREVYAL